MTPNLNYINKISGEDISFRNKLIDIVKREFPLEKEEFLNNYNNRNYPLSSKNVHKLKSKINVFGLDDGYAIAAKFEEELKSNKHDSFSDFVIILDTIENYLKEI